jgi:hypothetical protein
MFRLAYNELRPLKQTAFFYFMLAVVCTTLVAALFAIQGRSGFNLSDEGFLWYGTQRVLAGEIPIRDFMAYDPGRYYWSAAFMWLYNDNSIMSLRATVAIFQATGLFIGMALLARSSPRQNLILWSLVAITLMAWMYPRHKLFDISLSIALVGALSYLIQRPTSRRYFLTGLFVGLITIFGRNHGIYGAVGSLGAIIYFGLGSGNSPTPLKACATWGAGVVIGYFPVLLMIATVPGFAQAFWESIRFLFENKTTNIPLPIPWPWRVSFGQLSTIESLRGSLIGLFFIAIVAFGLLGNAWVIRQRLQNKPVSAALAASIFLALPYAHFAYSRADVAHLAQSIFPFLIGSLLMLASQPAKIKWSLAALLSGASLLVMLPIQPGWQCYSSQQCVKTDVAGNKLEVDLNTANELAMLRKLAEQFAPNGRSFVTAPFWPGAYAVMNRKSPMWEIYALSPRSELFQHNEIERIKAADPGFVVINDLPLDGRDDLRFRNTHPIIEQYLNDHFEPMPGYSLNPVLQIYRGKPASK